MLTSFRLPELCRYRTGTPGVNQPTQTTFTYNRYFSYDGDNRVNSNQLRSTATMGYDRTGNLKEVNTWIDKDNRLLKNNRYDFTYDAEGNRVTQQEFTSDTARTTLTGNWTYEYDHTNRLTRVVERHRYPRTSLSSGGRQPTATTPKETASRPPSGTLPAANQL